jgi:serine protease Do
MKSFSDVFRLGAIVLLILFARIPAVADDQAANTATVDLKLLFDGNPPQTIADLKAMQQHQQDLAKRLVQCTVAVVVGPAHGSGVIISEDGYVLTAAHVAGTPNRRATVILADGRRVRATTLGCHLTLDAGLMKITDAGPWPFAEMSPDDTAKRGQWGIVTGHPGGFQEGRAPVVRIGRVLTTDRFAVTTDCTLVGGDSGGPLFDMDGKVIGINSRIGRDLTANMHVPVVAYRESWDRLKKGDQWGHFPGTGPLIGVKGVADASNARIAEVYSNTPAEKAGIKAGDVIVKFNGRAVTDFASLQLLVNDCSPGDKVEVDLLRGDRRIQLKLEVGRQSS